MHQNTQNLNSNIYFEPPRLVGGEGALGGPNLDLTFGGFFLHRIKKFKKLNMFL